MLRKLLIVESPSKAKTLSQYLKGQGKFTVLATKGHIRDIPSKSNAIDVSNNFKMTYETIEKSAQNVSAIIKAAKNADEILLATDPDREGEAISWHVCEALSEAGINKDTKRVVFYQVTKKAVLEAISSPRELDKNLISAQQTRRALDYLVGFNLSPLLWKKIKPGLSAGRVQSPALVMITEREQEIAAHVPVNYYNIIANNVFNEINFQSKLIEYNSEKLEQFTIKDQTECQNIIESLTSQKPLTLKVADVTRKTRKSNPPAPFTTSTLQQEASKKYRFATSKTMRIAQQLYEGLEINGEQKGLITYMRTDSVHIGEEAIKEIGQFIQSKFGNEYSLASPRVFKSKSKNAQEAHEAIRPVSALLEPDKIKAHLDQDQYKLYKLIWARAIASQMQAAEYDTLTILFSHSNQAIFKSTGSTLKFAGYLKLYDIAVDETLSKKTDDAVSQTLPDLKIDDVVNVQEYVFKEHVTEPPPRYSEASLVKSLEEYGIGRPSTYSAIISTLVARNYAELKDRRFFSTDTGTVVSRFLKNYFTKYVDYDFTANLENDLDNIALGEKQQLPILKEFWHDLDLLVQKIDETVKRSDVTSVELEEKCPECQKPLLQKLGKTGNFIGCSGYPDCSYTRSLNQDGEAKPNNDKVLDRKCPKCAEPLLEKQGKFGSFIGCSGYPNCKHIEASPENATDVVCPKCQTSNIVKRFTKKGKVFFACSGFPKCKYAIWNEPVATKCQSCDWPIMTKKVSKKSGEEIICPECNKTNE